MASKKSSPAATKAARAMLRPSPEEIALRKLLAKNTECIIRLEKTVDALVRAMRTESRRKTIGTR